MDKSSIVKELLRAGVSKAKLINYLVGLGFNEAARCRTWDELEDYIINNPNITPEHLLKYKEIFIEGKVGAKKASAKEKVETKPKVTESITKEKLINDILSAFMELNIDVEEQLNIIRKKYSSLRAKIPEGRTIVDILRASPLRILESLHNDFVTGITGKRLVYEFWNWFKNNDKYVKEDLKKFKNEKLCRAFEYPVTANGKTRYIDLIVFKPGRTKARYIECKDWKQPVPSDVVKSFLDLVKSIKKAKVKPEPIRAIYVVSSMGYDRNVVESLKKEKYPFTVQLYEKTPDGTFKPVLNKKPSFISIF